MNEVIVVGCYVFLWIIFELLYCYNIGLEIFLGSIFYTFFPPTPPPPHTHPYKTLLAVGEERPQLVIRWCFQSLEDVKMYNLSGAPSARVTTNIGAVSKLMEVLTVGIPRSNPHCTPKFQSHQLFPKELII